MVSRTWSDGRRSMVKDVLESNTVVVRAIGRHRSTDPGAKGRSGRRPAGCRRSPGTPPPSDEVAGDDVRRGPHGGRVDDDPRSGRRCHPRGARPAPRSTAGCRRPPASPFRTRNATSPTRTRYATRPAVTRSLERRPRWCARRPPRRRPARRPPWGRTRLGRRRRIAVSGSPLEGPVGIPGCIGRAVRTSPINGLSGSGEKPQRRLRQAREGQPEAGALSGAPQACSQPL